MTEPSVQKAQSAGTGRERRRVTGLAVFVVGVACLFVAPFLHLAVRSLEQAGTLLAEITSTQALGSLGRSVTLAAAVSVAAATIGVTAA